jgi:hypothetical protein
VVRPVGEVGGRELADPLVVAVQLVRVQDVPSLSVAGAVEEVAVAEPDAVAAIGHEHVGSLLHLLEGAGLDELREPVVSDGDPECVAQVAQLARQVSRGSRTTLQVVTSSPGTAAASREV